MGAHRPWLHVFLFVDRGDEPTEFDLTSVGDLT
jgi:hypothetical protein